MAVFIHTSDWHIGSNFPCFDRETGKKLHRARLTAVESIFIYARMKKIPLILCAGDAVDNGQLAPVKNLSDLFAVIKRYPEITVAMITGNSDPPAANAVYHRVKQSDYPENLHLVTGSAIIPIEPPGLKIFAASPMEKSGDIDENKINIGLVHGGSGIEPGFAREKKLDYLALGERHGYKKIDDRTFFCGTPEPLDFGDDGYPLEVTIEKRGEIPKVEKITGVSQYRWTQQKLEISDEGFGDFIRQMETLPGEEKEIKRLEIHGSLSAENYSVYAGFLEAGRSRCDEIVDLVSFVPDAGDLSAVGDGYVKEMVQRLMSMKQTEEPLPAEILNGVVPADRLSVEQALNITKGKIIDKALLKLYKFFASGGREG